MATITKPLAGLMIVADVGVATCWSSAANGALGAAAMRGHDAGEYRASGLGPLMIEGPGCPCCACRNVGEISRPPSRHGKKIGLQPSISEQPIILIKETSQKIGSEI
jgi:hypothetical protein